MAGRWPHVKSGIYETPLARTLHRSFGGDSLGEVVAVLVLEEHSFFDAAAADDVRAEIARFFARCEPVCREPVAVPQHVLQTMAQWRGEERNVEVSDGARARVPDWSIALRRWLGNGSFYDYMGAPGSARIRSTKITPRQEKALRRVFYALSGAPFRHPERVRNISLAGWGRRGAVSARIYSGPYGVQDALGDTYLISTGDPGDEILEVPDTDLLRVERPRP